MRNLGLEWRPYVLIAVFWVYHNEVDKDSGVMGYGSDARNVHYVYQLTPSDIQKDLNCQFVVFLLLLFMFITADMFLIPP